MKPWRVSLPKRFAVLSLICALPYAAAPGPPGDLTPAVVLQRLADIRNAEEGTGRRYNKAAALAGLKPSYISPLSLRTPELKVEKMHRVTRN
jgi:hypothetical protein